MGEVYRTRDPRVGREVAIKVAAEKFGERFARAACAVAALNHPNILLGAAAKEHGPHPRWDSDLGMAQHYTKRVLESRIRRRGSGVSCVLN